MDSKAIGGPCKACGMPNIQHPGGHCTRTFDALFAEHNLTQDEKRDLVVYLASLRMAATLTAFGIGTKGGGKP